MTARSRLGASGKGTARVPPQQNIGTIYYQVVQDHGSDLPQELKLDFTGAGVSLVDDPANNRTIVTITGAGTAFYQTIEQNGTPRPQEDALNFVSAAFTVTDNPGNGSTDVTIASSPSNSATLVGTGRTIATTAPLAGGGNLGANLTLSVATVDGTTSGVVPLISAATAALVSDVTATSASWVQISGGGAPVGTSRTLATTAPLAGGGDLSADRTLSVATVADTTSGVVPAITAASAFLFSNGGGTAATWTTASGGGTPVGSNRTIATTAPLAGGGDLSANRTLSVATVADTTSGVVPAITAGTAALVSNVGGTAATWTAISGGGSPVGTSRTIATTAPLAGGGDLSANRTLSVATVSDTSSGVVPALTVNNGVLVANGTHTAVSTALLVNANVDPAAAIAGTKISPDFGSQNVVTTGQYQNNTATPVLRLGLVAGSGAGSAASIGDIRLRFQGAIYSRNDIDSTNFRLLDVGTSSGTNLVELSDGTVNVAINSVSGTNIQIVGVNKLLVQSSTVIVNTSTLQFNTGIGNVTFNVATSSSPGPATGQGLTIQAQNMSASTVSGTITAGAVTIAGGDATGSTLTHVGGTLTLRGGNATGSSGTRNGGNVVIQTGIGASANGTLTLQDGATVRMTVNSVGIGFYGAAAVAQAARVGQLTDSTTGTPSTTIPDVGGAFSQSTLNNINASFLAKFNALELAVHNIGLTV